MEFFVFSCMYNTLLYNDIRMEHEDIENRQDSATALQIDEKICNYGLYKYRKNSCNQKILGKK